MSTPPLHIAAFAGSLGLGGTEKACCEWLQLLKKRHHTCLAAALAHGPRAPFLDHQGIPQVLLGEEPASHLLTNFPNMEVWHMHAPGTPYTWDTLSRKLRQLHPSLGIVCTNIFGRLENPEEERWTDFRLFISWTSCVQAARRAGKKLDLNFFRKQSVAVYPVADPFAAGEAQQQTAVAAGKELREKLGISENAILFGRFARPDPKKWSDLPLAGFARAFPKNPQVHLLLQEPPTEVATRIRASPESSRISILPATADPQALLASQMACDVLLHTSSMGESFGYGIAEPMALGKPVITHSIPWLDQAQLELVRHGETGLLASTPRAIASAILHLASSPALREEMGAAARQHILCLADPTTSTNRLEAAFRCAIERGENAHAEEDLASAQQAAQHLDLHQWGHSLGETLSLWSHHSRVRMSHWRAKH